MEVPRLGVEAELQLLAYTSIVVCDLYHSSQQRWILNPLSEAGNQTRVLMDASRVGQPLSHHGNSLIAFLVDITLIEECLEDK